MKRDLARLRALVPASEKDKLDAYADAIAQLEASLQAKYGSTGEPASKPAVPPTLLVYEQRQAGLGQRLHRPGGRRLLRARAAHQPPACWISGQAQLRLIKAAFACDLGRVATFMWAAGTSWVRVPGHVPGRDDRRAALPSAPHHAVAQSAGDAATKGWLNQIDQFYSAATSTVLQEFATTPDIDGNMLIDNTIIVYFTEVARACDHNQQNMPVIIFGGKNTRVNGGTFLKVKGGPLPAQTGRHRKPAVQRPLAGAGAGVRRLADQPGRQDAVHGAAAGRFPRRVTPPVTGSAGGAARAASGEPRARRETAAGSG